MLVCCMWAGTFSGVAHSSQQWYDVIFELAAEADGTRIIRKQNLEETMISFVLARLPA